MTRVLTIVVACLAISGCVYSVPSKETVKLRGDSRQKLFVQCMELAAKIPRQADDDVANIVDSCSNQAAYITWYLEAR